MPTRVIRLTLRTDARLDRKPGCRLSILATSTGRNVWGTVVNLPHSQDETVAWLERRVPRACTALGGELLADVLAELDAEIDPGSPLLSSPAGQ